jgi:hypothetical protein
MGQGQDDLLQQLRELRQTVDERISRAAVERVVRAVLNGYKETATEMQTLRADAEKIIVASAALQANAKGELAARLPERQALLETRKPTQPEVREMDAQDFHSRMLEPVHAAVCLTAAAGSPMASLRAQAWEAITARENAAARSIGFPTTLACMDRGQDMVYPRRARRSRPTTAVL